MNGADELLVRSLGRAGYEECWRAMQAFTAARLRDTPDELWLLEHPPVFTQGQAGRQEHLLSPGDIPVVQSDRGGQVTYHGPGQRIGYVLFDLRRLGIGPRVLVERIEQALVATLADLGLPAFARAEAHGVYIGEKEVGGMPAPRKIASLGLRVRRGCSYHGFALNVDMDLAPFARINPCGHAGLAMTSLRAEGADTDPSRIDGLLVGHLHERFGHGRVVGSACARLAPPDCHARPQRP